MNHLQVASLWGLIVGAFCIGGVVGGSLVGLVSEKIGRKGGLLFNNTGLLWVAGRQFNSIKITFGDILGLFGAIFEACIVADRLAVYTKVSFKLDLWAIFGQFCNPIESPPGMSLVAAKYADTYLLLILGRFLIGINAGLNAGIAPMYLSEISPVALRGSVGTVYQLVITISIFISQVLGMKGVLGNEEGWPYLLGITVIPGIIQGGNSLG